MSSPTELLIQELKEDIDSLSENYKLIKRKARYSNEPGDKNNLEKQAEDILEQIQKKEDKLSTLEGQTDNQQYNQAYLDVEEDLSKFNFKSTVNVVEDVINKFSISNGTALFLLQNSISMGGEYFSIRLREILRTKTKAGNFHHRLIEFKEICPAKKIEVLNKFCQYFPTDCNSISMEEYTNQIIEKICESIPQSGHILFLEISGLEYMLEKEKIMPWFVKDFWHNLSTKLQIKLSEKKYRMVRIICLMKTDDNIPDDYLPSHIYYELANFNSSEVKELTIELCSRDEIEIFLYTYGGFDDQKVDQMVQLIHNTSDGGNPNLVCGRLKKILTQVN